MRRWIGMGALLVAACMNPADYEDKPDAPSAPPADTAFPPKIDTSPPVDAIVADTEDVLVMDALLPIDTPIASDTVPTDGTVPGEDSNDMEDTAVDAAPSASCVCQFSMPATTPTPQSYLWLTGDFLDPPWPGDKESGALQLILDPNTDLWTTTTLLTHGQVVAYKFLAGWPDNLGPVWRNQEGDSTPDAADSVLAVSCGQWPCSEVP